ncbi:MAG: dolichol kinase [Methanobacteriota archaeon]
MNALRNGDAKDTLRLTRQKVTEYQNEFLERMNAIEVDAHWFRRVFHTFGASFLFYYLLPEGVWGSIVKIVLPVLLVAILVVVEYRRLHGSLDQKRFFGLRNYERGRPASYLYFGVALLLLFLFFPQQIAIPCILCASFLDPIIGESRFYFGRRNAYLVGFFVSLFFFVVCWFRAEWWIVILVAVVGACGALVGESKKLRWLDDDFMIQMVPAVLLVVIWQGVLWFGVDILPAKLILPL